MSASRKPLPPVSNGQRPSSSSTPLSRRPSRSPTPSTPPPNHGLAPSRSIRGGAVGTPVSARAAAKRAGGGHPTLSASANTNGPDGWPDAGESDARAEAAAVIEDLKTRLQESDAAGATYQRQLESCQSRLDEALVEQGRLEDRVHESDEKAKRLAAEKKEAARQWRDMERGHEAEVAALAREREELVGREQQALLFSQRLKEKLAAQRDEGRTTSVNDNAAAGDDRFAPPPAQHRDDWDAPSEATMQAQLIESLRLELADCHIKLIESENNGGGRAQELEKALLETRMANARLMEDNESFQLLLSEKTLNGDFTKADLMQGSLSPSAESPSPSRGFGSSLADELESAGAEGEEGQSESYRRLEAEVKSMKDQNKALTLYISNIIERLLQHDAFEAILDKTPGLMSGAGSASSRLDKVLPPPPPPEASGESVLQRAKSVAQGNRPRPRPLSYMPPPVRANTTTEDPNTAPRIPLGRSQSVRAGQNQHRRTNSELGGHSAAAVVGQMYRGPPSGSAAVSPQSPGGVGGAARGSFFSPPLHSGNPNAAARIPSGSARPGSSENGDNLPSPPLPPQTTPPIAGNKLRPLRLVQENAELDAGPSGVGERKASDPLADADAAKRAKRSSWMGWFNKGEGGAF
ncbi:MAG: hypothetical protein M1832_003762 [Thelocarpon impressellum]|nr:MAG: hypothetical protein M1832_003762 [Thelocarpon impressellum]